MPDRGQSSMKMRKNEFRIYTGQFFLPKHMKTDSFSDMKTIVFIIFGNIIESLCIDLWKYLIIVSSVLV